MPTTQENTRTHDLIKTLAVVRAHAVFLSDLSRDDQLDAQTVVAAIRATLRRFGGPRGCAAQVAAEYGHHPDLFAQRMTWSIAVVRDCYPPDIPRARIAHAAEHLHGHQHTHPAEHDHAPGRADRTLVSA